MDLCSLFCKPIKDFPYYFIDMDGVVWSTKHHHPKKLKPALNKKTGYFAISIIHKSGKAHTKTIHRLVAETFLPNPKNYPVVMHLNEDPWNNFVWNLGWGNHSENITRNCLFRKLKESTFYTQILMSRFFVFKLFQH